MKIIICTKCAGNGKIDKYNHIDSGLCFSCQGSGKIEVGDNVPDVIEQIRNAKKKETDNEKEFRKIYEPLKTKIKADNEWYWYIMPYASNNTFNEQLVRLNQYIEFRKEWKSTIEANPDLINRDFDEIEKFRKEIESKYLHTR